MEINDYEQLYAYERYKINNGELTLIDNNFQGIIVKNTKIHTELEMPPTIYFNQEQKVELTEELKKDIEEWKNKGIEIINPESIISPH